LDKVALGQVSLKSFSLLLSIIFHHCSAFIHVSSGGRKLGPLAAHFLRDIASPNDNNNNNYDNSNNNNGDDDHGDIT
jgi:hypothetical protein